MTDYYEHKLDPVGVRPDWLADDDMFDWVGEDCSLWFDKPCYRAGEMSAWPDVTAIRIQRDHWAVPYLERGETPPSTRPTASEHPEYSPELVQEAFALLREVHAEPVSKWSYEPGFEDYKRRNEDRRNRIACFLSELDKSKEVDPLLEAFDALPIDFSGCIDGPDQLRRELDKRGYAITRKDEAA